MIDYMLSLSEFPGSKSLLQRWLILSTYQDSAITLSPTSTCEDVLVLIQALQTCGKVIRQVQNGIVISGVFNPRDQVIHLKESATSFRLLVARLSAIPACQCRIVAAPALLNRPHTEFYSVLRTMGATITELADGLAITGAKLTPSSVNLPTSISSQFASALCLTLPAMSQPMTISVPDVSLPYYHMTVSILESCGYNAALLNSGRLQPIHNWSLPERVHIEPDLSSLSYLIGAALFLHIRLTLQGFPKSSVQSDLALLHHLRSMGIEILEDGDKLIINHRALKGTVIDGNSIPDLIPLLVILALTADSPSTFYNLVQLQYKESNRLLSLCKMLDDIKAVYQYDGDKLVVHPLRNAPPPVTLATKADHRMVMSFSLLQLCYPTIQISDKDAVGKSFPEFFDYLQNLTSTTGSMD